MLFQLCIGFLLAVQHFIPVTTDIKSESLHRVDTYGCLKKKSSEVIERAQSIPSPTWHRGTSLTPQPVDSVAHFSHAHALERLKAMGFFPDTILDIGANSGIWSRGAWNVWCGSPDSAATPLMLMVEGSEFHTEALEATGFHFSISLVGSSTNFVKFYASDRAHTGNSVFRENTKHNQEFPCSLWINYWLASLEMVKMVTNQIRCARL